MPAAGIPLRRLAARSLRTTEADVHAVLDPIRLGASVPQATAILLRERPDAIFTTGGYVAVPVLMAAAPLRIPVVMWDGNVIPGRAVRATARLAAALAVSFEATCRALGAAARSRPCYVTGTPIRDIDAIDRVAARTRLGIAPSERVLLIFGGSQAVRRFNAAVAEALPRLVERVTVIHVTGEDGYAAALAGREDLGETTRGRYRPYPFLRDDMLAALAAADLVVGRAGSSTLAEVTAMGLPMVVVPYPHAAGHQRANAGNLVEAGAARLIDDDAFDAEALLDAARLLEDPAAHAAMSAAARALARPGAGRGGRRAGPRRGGSRALPRAGRDRTPGTRTRAMIAAFDAIATGTDIQRRIGVKTSRDEPLARFTTMRVGGPADLFATVHNAHELRALVRFARTRELPHLVLGRGSDIVIADAGVRGLVIQVRAEGSRTDGDRYTAEAGVQMARAATETQRAGLTGLEFGLAIPGTVGGAVWANAGAHDADIAGVLESARVLAIDGTETIMAATELGLSYRDSRFKTPDLYAPAGSPRDIVIDATFHLATAEPEVIKARLDEIRHWRQAHQPLGLPSAGSVFRNPDGDSAGRLIEAAGLKGRRIGGAVVSEKHANFIVNDEKGSATDVRSLAEHVRAEVLARDGIALEFEIEFVGDWSDWVAAA